MRISQRLGRRLLLGIALAKGKIMALTIDDLDDFATSE